VNDVAEDEPDYRFTLANERTFLAWIRTSLALDAGGLAVLHLLPELGVPGAREVLGLALVALGAVLTVASYRRWQAYQDALRRNAPLPQSRLPLALVVALTALSALTAVLLVVVQLDG
jgi:putative membrane protein